jgi:hypothetical protein
MADWIVRVSSLVPATGVHVVARCCTLEGMLTSWGRVAALHALAMSSREVRRNMMCEFLRVHKFLEALARSTVGRSIVCTLIRKRRAWIIQSPSRRSC